MNNLLKKTLLLLLLVGVGLGSYIVVGHRSTTSPQSTSILFDDSHSNWAWAGPAFDSEAFGEKRLYESSLFLDFMSKFHKISINSSGVLTPELLANYKVVILKTPTKPYTASEIEAIHNHVRQGGSVFAIGDHTNLYGMSDYLNEVVTPMGINFVHDDQFSLSDGGPSVYQPSQFQNKHPILEGLGSLEFMTGCTLTTKNGRSVLSVNESGQEMLDYSQVSLFGDIKLQHDESFGRYSMITESKFGNGTVIALSDSTIMANFSVHHDSKLQLFSNILQYLASPSDCWISDRHAKNILCVMVFIVIIVAIISSRLFLVLTLTSIALGVTSSLVSHRINNNSIPLVPIEKYKYVEFDLSNSHALFGQTLDNNVNTVNNRNYYDCLFINFARVGVKPFWADHFTHYFPPILKVFVKPHHSVDAKAAILDGNIDSLVIMDISDPRNRAFCAALCKFSIDDKDILSTLKDSAVSFLELPSGLVVFQIKHENKSIYLASPPDLFSRAATGPVYHNPNDKELEALKNQMILLRWVLKK